jgi:hypothetical protein
MKSHNEVFRRSLLLGAVIATFAGSLSASFQASAAGTLEGFASLPAATFSKGPTAGQFVNGANGEPLPLIDQQAVQGFSAVLPGPVAGSYQVMCDNGFGTKANSSDALLRFYTMKPNFRHWDGSAVVGTGAVKPVDRISGEKKGKFATTTFATLSDPDHRLGFALVADGVNYPYSGSGPGSASIPVDKSIQKGRLLTGSDLDIESMRVDKNGHYWFGDEFGPFLIKTDADGKVLRSEIPLMGVQSPDNPYLNGATPTLNSSNGYEGLAINAAGDTLYALLEGTVVGDVARSLRINEFSIDQEAYTGKKWLYSLDPSGTNIGDMTAVNSHQFIVIERNGTQEPRFKKLFLIDLDIVDPTTGFVQKTELVDLMNIADPHDLNADGQTVFTFPFVTIEDVLVLDAKTLLVMNDDNYPGSSRTAGVPDPNEFLKIRLDQKLQLK